MTQTAAGSPESAPMLPSRRTWLLVVLGAIVVVGLVGFSIFRQQMRVDAPVTYASDEDHFKYGSITSDVEGVPYWIWLTMPEVCPKLLPGGYTSLGIIQEPGRSTPIGFSTRRVGFLDQVGPNCALCHTGTLRKTATSDPQIYLTAPANQLDLMGYFRFLFGCGNSADFTTENVVAAIERHKKLGLFERFIYGRAIPTVKAALQSRVKQFDSITVGRPAWGPGRVDTFNPYKVLVFNMDMSKDTSVGTADFMSIWDQRSRENLWLHWDGNNDSLDERNLSAAIGAGATPASLSHGLDMDAITRVKSWIMNRRPPPFPFAIDYAKVAAGRPVFERECASCHESGRPNFGAVIPLALLQTDPERNKAFDADIAARMNTIGAGRPWAFHHFRRTEGYASHPLDGIWLRGPFLHNGSVPTLRDLLSPPDQRPAVFYRGNDVYDPVNVGFVSDVPEAHGRAFYRFDTKDQGNGNGGHLYGLDLPAGEKSDLIEYLKTL
jgi:mono/diheme cytochrome c family protein